MASELKTKKVRYVWDHDLDDFIVSVYKRPYQLTVATVAGGPVDQEYYRGYDQDSLIRISVPGELEEHEDAYFGRFSRWIAMDAPAIYGDDRSQGRHKEWIEQHSPPLQAIMNDLFYWNEIKGGEYVIHIWW